MSTVRVNLGPRSYDIVVTSDDATGLGPFARGRARGTLAVVVTEDLHLHVPRRLDKAFDVKRAVAKRRRGLAARRLDRVDHVHVVADAAHAFAAASG